MDTSTKQHAGEIATEIELLRSTDEEKGQQIANVLAWQTSRNPLAPVGETEHLEAVKTHSLGQISHGEYRRSM